MNLEPFSLILQKASGLTLRNAAGVAATNFIEERQRSLGLNTPEDYQQRLEQDVEEKQRFIEAVAVLETWFHRDVVAFETLAKLAKDRLKKNPAPLRILCLPCSTGEEAYNIAAALIEAGLTPEQFTVDAVDINGSALKLAEAGEYKTAAFRKCPEEFRQKHFASVSEDTLRLTAEWKSLVKFRQGNLLQLETVASGEPYDFVFNRNLLIYFARPDQAKALAHLRQLLKPEGVIFVAAGEGGIFLANGFRTLRIPHAFAFRQAPPRQERPKVQPAAEGAEGKADEAAKAEGVDASAPASEASGDGSADPAGSENPEGAPATTAEGEQPAAAQQQPKPQRPERQPRQRQERPERQERGERPERPERQGQERPERAERPERGERTDKGERPERQEKSDKPEKQEKSERQPKQQQQPKETRRAASPEDTVDIIEDVKELAEAGNLVEAEAKLRGLLAGGSSDADAHFLMGLLQDAQGDAVKAIATYRRVVQLDGNHQEAVKMLIELAEMQGDTAELEKLHAKMNRILQRNQPRRLANKPETNPS
ncbi:MAG TPA: CheR family methyltransferase [Verrucomicrobiae bacterium]